MTQELDFFVEEVTQRCWDVNNHTRMDKEVFKERLAKLLNKSKQNELYIVFKFIFENFIYYSKKDVNSYLKLLYENLYQTITTDNCIYGYIRKKHGAINSSIDYAIEFKNLNNIDPSFFSDDFKELPEGVWEHIENIVIVDDCCGTGGTIKDFIVDLELDFSNKTLYYLVIHQMADSESSLATLESLYENFTVKCLSINRVSKVITDNLEISCKKDQFIEFSLSQGINNSLVLGYKSSESIFSFYNNTPNNTLGVLHAFSRKNQPVFPRRKKTQTPWQKLADEKKQREANLANQAQLLAKG